MLPLVAVLLAASPDAGALPTYYYDRPITAADLQGKTLRELSLTRNVIFARAGQVFRKKWVRDYFTQFPWYAPTGLDKKKLTKLDSANAEVVAKFEIGLPRDALRTRRDALAKKLEPMKDPPKDEVVELFLLSEAVGLPPPDFALLLDPTKKRHPLSSPAVLDELLTLDQLSDLSKRDLRILRNTVFARRGRPFQTDTMRDYFSKKEWYRADEKYTDKRLTKTDLTNIKLIRSVEDSLGGPEVEPGSEPPDGYMMQA